MGWLEDVRKLAEQARAHAYTVAPVVTNQLTIRQRVWAGGRPGMVVEGFNDIDLVLPARYPVRHLTQQELNASAGRYEVGDILVDGISPSDGAGSGYTPEQLAPTITTDDVELIYVITGDHAGEYSLVEARTFRAFTYQLVLRRRSSTP